MTPYKSNRGFSTKLFIIIFAIFSLISYGLFNARNLIIGPSIEIFSPTNIETKENTVVVKGRVRNITFISLNERPIFVDKEGFFEEKLLIYPGFNIIELRAKDRFKQEVLKIIKVYYKKDER